MDHCIIFRFATALAVFLVETLEIMKFELSLVPKLIDLVVMLRRTGRFVQCLKMSLLTISEMLFCLFLIPRTENIQIFNRLYRIDNGVETRIAMLLIYATIRMDDSFLCDSKIIVLLFMSPLLILLLLVIW